MKTLKSFLVNCIYSNTAKVMRTVNISQKPTEMVLNDIPFLFVFSLENSW